MRIFGIIGQSAETLVLSGSYTPAAGEIEMRGPRPSPAHAAQADGAWALPAVADAEIAAQRIVEIDARLTEIDLASVRALRASVAGTATEDDAAQLAALETEASALRTERAELTAA